MYCESCGAKFEEGQNLCGACRRQSGTVAPLVAAQAAGRVARHLRRVAILWIVFPLFRIVGGLGALFVGSLAPLFLSMNSMAYGLGGFMKFFGVVSLAYAAVGIAAALGLFERKGWARGLALIVSIRSPLEVRERSYIGPAWMLVTGASTPPNIPLRFPRRGMARRGSARRGRAWLGEGCK